MTYFKCMMTYYLNQMTFYNCLMTCYHLATMAVTLSSRLSLRGFGLVLRLKVLVLVKMYCLRSDVILVGHETIGSSSCVVYLEAMPILVQNKQ